MANDNSINTNTAPNQTPSANPIYGSLIDMINAAAEERKKREAYEAVGGTYRSEEDKEREKEERIKDLNYSRERDRKEQAKAEQETTFRALDKVREQEERLNKEFDGRVKIQDEWLTEGLKDDERKEYERVKTEGEAAAEQQRKLEEQQREFEQKRIQTMQYVKDNHQLLDDAFNELKQQETAVATEDYEKAKPAIEYGGEVYDFSSNELRLIRHTLNEIEYIRKAATDKESGSLRRFAKGLFNTVSDVNTWSGLEQVLQAGVVRNAFNKVQDGKELTERERAVVGAVTLSTYIHLLYDEDIPLSEKVGQGIGHMIPFVAKIATGEGALDGIFGKVASSGMKKFLSLAARNLALSGTIFLPDNAAKAMNEDIVTDTAPTVKVDDNDKRERLTFDNSLAGVDDNKNLVVNTLKEIGWGAAELTGFKYFGEVWKPLEKITPRIGAKAIDALTKKPSVENAVRLIERLVPEGKSILYEIPSQTVTMTAVQALRALLGDENARAGLNWEGVKVSAATAVVLSVIPIVSRGYQYTVTRVNNKRYIQYTKSLSREEADVFNNLSYFDNKDTKISRLEKLQQSIKEINDSKLTPEQKKSMTSAILSDCQSKEIAEYTEKSKVQRRKNAVTLFRKDCVEGTDEVITLTVNGERDSWRVSRVEATELEPEAVYTVYKVDENGAAVLREDGSREVRYVKEGEIAEREVVSERDFLESYDKNVAEQDWKDGYLGAMADTGGDGRGNNVVERIVGYDADGFRTESGRVLPYDDVRGGSVRVFDPDNVSDLLGMTIVSPAEARARNTAMDVNDGNQGVAPEQGTADAERLAEENNSAETLANPQENGNFAAENGGEHLAVNITQNAGADVSDGNGGFTARNRMGTLNEQDRQTVKTNFAMLQDPNATPAERARAEEAVEEVKVRRKNQMRVLVNEALKDIEGVSNPEIEAGIGVYTDDSGNVVTEYTCVVHLDVANGKEDAAIAAMSLISETTRQDAFIVNYDKAAEGQQQRGDHSYEARVTLDRPLTNAETARLTQEFRNNGLDVTITDRAITSLSWPESDADRVVFENKVKQVIDSYNNASRTNNGRQSGRQAPQDNRGTWSAEQGNGEGVVADAHRVSSESGTVQGGDNNTGNTIQPPVFSDHYSDYNSANITNGKYVNHEGREFANQDKRNYGGATDPATGARAGYYQENDVYIQGTSVTPKDLRERLKRKYEETERKDYDYARGETQQQSQQTLDISGSTAKELIEQRAEQRREDTEQQQQQQAQARAAMSETERLVYDAVSDRLDKAGIKVELATEEEVKGVLGEIERGGNTEAQIVSDEMTTIKRTAQENGSFMKAPNGKKTRLTEQQWLQTRTKAFKEWYGDWELADKEIPITNVKDGQTLLHFATREDAEIWGKNNISQTLSNEQTNGKGVIVISKNSVEKYCSDSALKKSVGRDVHYATLQLLPQVIRDGIIVESHPDYKKGSDGMRNANNGIGSPHVTMHILYGAVDVDGTIYRVKVTLKEDRSNGRPTGAHSYETTEIELMAGQNGQAVTSPRYSTNSIPLANLLKDVESSKGNGRKILPSPEMLDENGEPRIFYHGSRTGDGFTVFNTPAFFSDNFDVADMFKSEADVLVSINGKKPVALDRISAEELAVALTEGDYRIDEMYGWDINPHEFLEGNADNQYGLPDGLDYALRNIIDTEYNDIKRIKIIKPHDVYDCYIDIRNPLVIYFGGKTWGDDGTAEMEAAVRTARQKGYDGVVVKNIVEGGFAGELRNGEEVPLSTDVIPLDPAQIKSATENKGTFSRTNPDIELLRRNDGVLLGWADKDGGIHLTRAGMNPETPIHEYSHLWGRMMKRRNPELWKSIVEMCRSEENKVWWDAVANDPNYAHLNGDADAIASEMMSRYVGSEGAKRLEAEARKMYEQARRNGTLKDGITVRSFVHKMRQSVLYYWNRVAEFLGIRRFKNLEDIERGVIGDLMNGRKFRSEDIKSSSSERLSSSVADPLGSARERVQRRRNNSSLDDFIAQELGMTAERMSQSLQELPQRVRDGMEDRLNGIGERLERIEALDATERELNRMFTEEYDWEQREQTREAVEEHLRQVREERERLKNEIRGLEEELDNTLINGDLFYEDTMADGLRRGERSNDSGEQSSGTLGEDYEPFKAGDLRDLTAEELVLAAMRQNAERVGEAGNNGRKGLAQWQTTAMRKVDEALRRVRGSVKDMGTLINQLITLSNGEFTKGEVKTLRKAMQDGTYPEQAEALRSMLGKMSKHLQADGRRAMHELLDAGDTSSAGNGLRSAGVTAGKDGATLRSAKRYIEDTSTDRAGNRSDRRDKLQQELSELGTSDVDMSRREDIEAELAGIDYAEMYDRSVGVYEGRIRAKEARIKEINDSLTIKDANGNRRRNPALSEAERTALETEKNNLQWDITHERVKAQEAYAELNEHLISHVEGGKESKRSYAEREQARRSTVNHLVDRAMTNTNIYRDGSVKSHNIGRRFRNWLLSPLKSAEYYLSVIDGTAADGRGALYHHFMDKAVRSMQKNKEGRETVSGEIFERTGNIFGVNREKADGRLKDWSVKGSGYKPSWLDFEGKSELTNGQLMYLYMVSRMRDGAEKLQMRGVDIADLQRAAESRREVKEIADYFQMDLYPRLARRYNSLYKKLYGVSMDLVDNYVPLKLKGSHIDPAGETLIDINNNGQYITSREDALIPRVENEKDVDVTTNGVTVMFQHLNDMESWYAYAELTRDCNILLSNKQLRDYFVQSGTGEIEQFKNGLSRMCDQYNSYVGTKANGYLSGIYRAVATSKVSFKLHTAFKQLLSLPTYLVQGIDEGATFYKGLITNIPTAMSWCRENLPIFRERIKAGNAGDVRVLSNRNNDFVNETEEKAVQRFLSKCTGSLQDFAVMGMLPNRAVDSFVCSLGAKAGYDAEYERSIALGFSAAQAHERAIIHAEQIYNLTQQSAVGGYISDVQANRTISSAIMTTFRNSQISYGRQIANGFNTFANMRKNGKDYYIAQEVENLRAQGATNETAIQSQAAKRVNAMYAKSAFQVFTYACLMPFIWENVGKSIGNIFTGTSDVDKEESLRNSALEALMGGALQGTGVGFATDPVIKFFIESNPMYIQSLFETLPHSAIEDVSTIIKDNSTKNDFVSGCVIAGDVLSMALSMGTGVDLTTLTDILGGSYGMLANLESYVVDVATGKRSEELALKKERSALESIAPRDRTREQTERLKEIDLRLTSEEFVNMGKDWKLSSERLLKEWQYSMALMMQQPPSVRTKFVQDKYKYVNDGVSITDAEPDEQMQQLAQALILDLYIKRFGVATGTLLYKHDRDLVSKGEQLQDAATDDMRKRGEYMKHQAQRAKKGVENRITYKERIEK